jgi:hypothetical protein
VIRGGRPGVDKENEERKRINYSFKLRLYPLELKDWVGI